MAPKKTADVLAEASAKSGLEGLRVLVRRQDDARAALGALPKARAAKFFEWLSGALDAATDADDDADGYGGAAPDGGGADDLDAAARAAAGLALAALDDSTGEAPELLNVACALHERLFALRDEAAQHAVAKLCEAWYLANRPGAELLLTQLVPFLLIRSLESDAPEAVVKRVHAMRSALLLLDFEDASSASLQALLLRCFISPLYLRSAEGKRMLLFLFRLHPALVDDIAGTVKAQLAHAPPPVRRAYGELYLRAWRDAAAGGTDEPFGTRAGGAGADPAGGAPRRARIEESCVQELMRATLFAADPKACAAARDCLAPLLAAKSAPGVDAMLLRCYGPLLWRAAAAPHAGVRARCAARLAGALRAFRSRRRPPPLSRGRS